MPALPPAPPAQPSLPAQREPRDDRNATRDAMAAAVAATAPAPGLVDVLRPGLVPYPAALTWQHARAGAIAAGTAREALVLLEHPPVVTLGRRANSAHVLASHSALAAQGIAVAHTDRGGDVTFHGPGQLIAYPLLHLRRRGIGPATYVRALEQAVIATLARCEIIGARVPGRPGVWVGNAKVAAIGVRVRGGVSMHGLALNVNPDLRAFETIVPCGLSDARVTSMEALCGARSVPTPSLAAVAEVLTIALADTLRLHCIPADAALELPSEHTDIASGAADGH